MPHHPQCFTAAQEIGSECETCEIIHGWQFKDNEWRLHAWAEVDVAVYDLTISNKPMLKTDYYAEYGITEERLIRYERVAYFTLMAENGHFGPFDRDFFFAETSDIDPLEVIKGKTKS